MATKRQQLMSDIIKIITGWDIPVSFTHREVCTIYSTYYPDSTGKLKRVKPESITFSFKMNYWPEIYDYLTSSQKEVWANYNPYLFSILHEIGHVHTLVGMNWAKNQEDKANVRKISKSYEEVCANYRKLEAESRADTWATDWVIEHSDLARALSDKITKEFK
jgi:hypothetical protein